MNQSILEQEKSSAKDSTFTYKYESIIDRLTKLNNISLSNNRDLDIDKIGRTKRDFNSRYDQDECYYKQKEDNVINKILEHEKDGNYPRQQNIGKLDILFT